MAVQPLKKNEYFHGTRVLEAMWILYEGFRIKPRWCRWGRYGTFGYGIYLTKSLQIAGSFGYYVFRCALAKNTRLLKLDGIYDPKVIQYLRKEFGNVLFKGDFSKAIPTNKQLTKKELISLLNYRFISMGDVWNRKKIEKWDSQISSLRQQLLRHKFDAIGEDKDVVGIAVLSPSLVELREFCLWKRVPKAGEHTLIGVDNKIFAREIKNEISYWREFYNKHTPRPNDVRPEDYDYAEELLKRLCSENNIDFYTL